MNGRRGLWPTALLLVATACSSAVQSAAPGASVISATPTRTESPDESSTDERSTGTGATVTRSSVPATDAGAEGTSTSATTPVSPTTTAVRPSTTSSTTTSTTTTSTTTTSTTTTSTTSTTTSTTTTTLPPLDVFDAACVVQVQPGQTLTEIVVEFDDLSVDNETVMAENGLASEELDAFVLLDLCVDNGLDDIDGSERTERNAVVVRRAVEAQQIKLNELFDGYGIRELDVDGVSGPVTRQRLCAFRLAAGLPVTLTDMAAGSDEEQALMAAETLPIPFTSSILSERWSLADLTCQIMFVGEGTERVQFVFPTSSGIAEFPTRPQDRSEAFKYNSASRNGGWHDSYDYPAAEDNPLNGNMYKPIYFDRGQAIHGANNVPRSPASHGCLRLRVSHMDALVDWLGLGGVSGSTTDNAKIDLTVNVQGRYGSA